MNGEEPSPRRRVRTGCLTCRTRRKKCDEGRPGCNNCKSKGLICRYGVNVTFVTQEGRKRARQRPSRASEALVEEVARNDVSVPSNIFDNSLSYDSTHTDHGVLQEEAAQQDNGDRNVERSISSIAAEIQRPGNLATSQRTTEWDASPLASNAREINQSIAGPYVAPTSVRDPRNLQCQFNQEEQDLSIAGQRDMDNTREQYELDLLHHYRYRIATILDLNIGSLHFGIEAMLLARKSPLIYKAMLAVSSTHRAAVESAHRELDKATSAKMAGEAHVIDHTISHREVLVRSVWASVVILITEEPKVWIELLQHTLSQIPPHAVCHDNRPLLARFVLAAVVAAPLQKHSNLINGFLEDPLTLFHATNADHAQHELQTVLTLLAESAQFMPGVALRGKLLLNTWQACWRSLGEWYSKRSVRMQEILQLSDANDPSSQDQRIFPLILFSNACAIVANVAYHLAAILLLLNKPRLAKTPTRYGSSNSSILHTQRLMGIADTAADTEFWDPLIAVAVVHAAKRLSHHKQRYATAKVLGKIAKASGIKLEAYIQDFISPSAL